MKSNEASRSGEYDHDCDFPPELYGLMLPPLEEELSMEEQAEEYFEEIDNFVLAIENMKDK